ncbi:hypothetical protein [Streptomyces sioyaensis]|uniref:hypothetical protein n=1 Tax=Streptomyces sioyaensis TaxID=67364 RepID=UPI001FD3A28F|nr:hypothetical protein [Streptomyces sioyaensis]
MRGSHLSRTRTLTGVLALATAGTVALSGCGQQKQTVGTAPAPKKQDAFERRADQLVRDWPKVSPVAGRQQALLPLGDRGHLRPVPHELIRAPAPKKQDAFERRADQLVRDWPKVSPVAGRQQALLPLAGADRPKDKGVREITVTVGHSACDAHFGARSHESKDLVVITGWGKRKSNKGMCTEQLATDKVTVRLKSALDGRKVVDAATGKQLLKG